VLPDRAKYAREKSCPKSGTENNKDEDKRKPPPSRQNSAATHAPIAGTSLSLTELGLADALVGTRPSAPRTGSEASFGASIAEELAMSSSSGSENKFYIPRVTCPRCGEHMRLARTEPLVPQTYHRMTFDCTFSQTAPASPETVYDALAAGCFLEARGPSRHAAHANTSSNRTACRHDDGG